MATTTDGWPYFRAQVADGSDSQYHSLARCMTAEIRRLSLSLSSERFPPEPRTVAIVGCRRDLPAGHMGEPSRPEPVHDMALPNVGVNG